MEFIEHPKSKLFNDLTGDTYNKLTFIGYAGNKGICYYWWCKCECGNIKKIESGCIKNGRTKSCGCAKYITNTKHGMRKSIEYSSYISAKNRCINTNNPSYKYYGGRGIKFLFNTFEDFYQHIGPRISTKYSIDRIDNNGNYEHGNVRWATIKEQSINKRPYKYGKYTVTYNNRTYTLIQWCRDFGADYKKMWYRMKTGKTFEESLELCYISTK